MVQNFVRVRQEYKHIIVKGAGGLRGETGPQGPEGPAGPQGPQGATGIQGEQGVQGIQGPKGDPGAGLVITGSVNTYADLPNDLGPDDAGEAFFVQADGKLYVWSGTAWPADGEGSQFEGPQGPQGVQGPQGIQGPQGEPGTDANVVNALSQSTTDAYSAKYINDNNYTKTETDTLLAAKAPANEVAYIGQEVAGGSTLIGTSDIAPGAITTSKVADGAITSDKIDWTTLGTTVATLTADTNVTVGAAYTFVPVTGLTLTPSDAPAGAKFLVDVSLALKAPAGTGRDRYVRVIYNGQNYGGCGVNSDAGDWVCISALAIVPYNGSGSIEIQIASSTTGTHQVLSKSTAVAFRV